jgi:hypothetical protein
MSDVRIIVWFTWFLAKNWLEPFAVSFKERIAKAVNSMKKNLPFILRLLLLASFLLTLPATIAADDDAPIRLVHLNCIQCSVAYQPSGESVPREYPNP